MKRLQIVLLLVSFILAGCRTQSIPPAEVHTDSVRVSYRLDSVYIFEKDSIYIDRWRSNDTIYIDRVHEVIRYKDKIVLQADTTANDREETKVVTVEVIPAFYKWCTGLFFALLAINIIVIIIKIKM